jgi:hypothetical protein
VTAFYFSIPFAPKTNDRSWRRASRLLADTIASLQQQSDGDWQAIVAGHDRPDVAELSDPRVTFITVDTPKPEGHTARVADAGNKREATLQRIRGAGGGYVMMLDADDLVHRELVAFVRQDQHPHGYIIDKGYVEHYPTGSLRSLPPPGGFPPFHRVCGSSMIFRLTPDDIGAAGHATRSILDRFGPEHVHWAAIAAALDRPLAPVPFPAAIYRFNSGTQLSIVRIGRLRYLLAALYIEIKRRPHPERIRLDFLPAQKAVHRRPPRE